MPVILATVPVGPNDVWSQWVTDPLAALTLLVAVGLHARGTASVWRAGGRGHVVRRGHVVAWWLAVLALFVALVSPLDALAGTLFSAHMAQHMLLSFAAAPLLVLARPALPLLQGLPHAGRRRASRAYARVRRLRRWTTTALWPVAVVAAYTGVLWLWHLPGPYEAALTNDLVHAAEHASLLATAVLLWWTIAQSGTRQAFGYGAGIAIIFVAGLQHAALGTLFAIGPGTWYPAYEAGAAAWGMSPVEDQALAGVLMGVPGKLVHGVVVVLLLLAWLRDVEERSRRREAEPTPGGDDPLLSGR